ncbi:Retron-type RNA-directed DNA polymerase [hydrothermal vent metagenome]|uniref:Retron-type RNA-directed DNA polymerase n=1 Tax=hydrothermal vent metagenome TaxID=652676 RepID=A0A3B1A1P6_9ZZZZ
MASCVALPPASMQSFLRGIAYKAKTKPEYRFRDLSRCIDEELLSYCFHKKLNKKAASGVDQVTYEDYKENLSSNLEDLIGRLKRGGYRARLVKRKYIPKSPGKKRALGLPVLEDKLLQTAVSVILGAIYEQDFHAFSYGYRPRRGARQAADDLTVRMQFGRFGYVVEADIKGFFNHIEHEKLLEIIAQRVDDKRFLRLIKKWLKAGILEEDKSIIYPEEGTPQGGSVSAMLANIYLHHVVDEWFEKVVKPHCDGEAIICRYADDFVCAFQYKSDAERFYKVLPKRLEKFNLEVAEDKTNLLRFSRFEPGLKNRFSFLSFEFYWTSDSKGKTRLFRRTDRERLQRVKRDYKAYIKENRHMKTSELIGKLKVKLSGHCNYFGVIGNLAGLYAVKRCVTELLYKWLNRRSGRKSFTWDRLKHYLYYNPLPEVVCRAKPALTKVWW